MECVTKRKSIVKNQCIQEFPISFSTEILSSYIGMQNASVFSESQLLMLVGYIQNDIL